MSSPEEIIEIVMDEKKYNVSKSKLIEKSDYFRALYSSGMRESGQDSVHLQGLSVMGLDLVLEFISTSKVQIANETLEDLIETASFLQVTPILKLLQLEVQLDNCVELFKLSEVYGTHELRASCLKFMSCYYHPMLRRPEFRALPAAFREQMREMRMRGTASLVTIGELGSLSINKVEDQARLGFMLQYREAEQRWTPLHNNFPGDMVDVTGYGSAVLDNYLFIVGGYRMMSHNISAAHCYNPCLNEWTDIAPLNQKRAKFALVAVSGKLYAVGGHCLGTVECYSPEQDCWTCVSSMPNPLTEFSACECQGMIYVMGGYTTRDRNTNVLRYCPLSDTWSIFSTSTTHVRKQQMLAVEDTIYLVGGYTQELQQQRTSSSITRGSTSRSSSAGTSNRVEGVLTVQSYNVCTGEWLQLNEKSSKSGLNLTCALHNDGIYIMNRTCSCALSIVFLKYNIFSDAWEAFRQFPNLGQNMLLCSLYLPDVP